MCTKIWNQQRSDRVGDGNTILFGGQGSCAILPAQDTTRAFERREECWRPVGGEGISGDSLGRPSLWHVGPYGPQEGMKEEADDLGRIRDQSGEVRKVPFSESKTVHPGRAGGEGGSSVRQTFSTHRSARLAGCPWCAAWEPVCRRGQ